MHTTRPGFSCSKHGFCVLEALHELSWFFWIVVFLSVWVILRKKVRKKPTQKKSKFNQRPSENGFSVFSDGLSCFQGNMDTIVHSLSDGRRITVRIKRNARKNIILRPMAADAVSVTIPPWLGRRQLSAWLSEREDKHV
ncbi:MAG: hypothetical protein ACFNLH_10265 [Corynebacterium matruchotii]